jgi:ectoine hydroxylase-related dioxygenase (phytanoyl-CoA dioxygenase family)
VLNDRQLRSFWSNGYLPIGEVAVPRDLAVLKAEAFRLLRSPARGSEAALPDSHVIRSGAGRSDGAAQLDHVRVALHLCHLSEPFRVHALNTRAVSVVRSIFGNEPAVLTSLLFNKPAHVGQAVTLHQDLPYYPYLGSEDLVTCWTALNEAGSDNGCVEYLPGSHRSPISHGEADTQPLEIDPDQVDTSRLVPALLKPGEGVVHHGWTAHRSAANRSGRGRLGVATLYTRASARVSLDDFPYPLLRTIE